MYGSKVVVIVRSDESILAMVSFSYVGKPANTQRDRILGCKTRPEKVITPPLTVADPAFKDARLAQRAPRLWAAR